MNQDKDLKMTLRKECTYCKSSRVEQKGDSWQVGSDKTTAPSYTKYICLDCGERFIVIDK